MGNLVDLEEVIAIEKEARSLGAEAERDRLRPLLERCQTRIRAIRGSLRVEDMDLLDDLRRELGKGG